MMTDAEHGTRERYVQGCHCDYCRTANTIWHSAYMAANPEQKSKDRERHNQAYRAANDRAARRLADS